MLFSSVSARTKQSGYQKLWNRFSSQEVTAVWSRWFLFDIFSEIDQLVRFGLLIWDGFHYPKLKSVSEHSVWLRTCLEYFGTIYPKRLRIIVCLIGETQLISWIMWFSEKSWADLLLKWVIRFQNDPQTIRKTSKTLKSCWNIVIEVIIELQTEYDGRTVQPAG